MTIVVTGAHGQLGRELCRQLGEDATALDIDTLDLTDGPSVQKTLARWQPQAVVNCAAYTKVDQAEREPEQCRAVNALAVEHLARACEELDCPLVQISTDYVFGGGQNRHEPYREDEPPAPQGVYARSKLDGERAAARYRKHLVVRTCGLYARPGDDRAQNFVKTILRVGLEKGRVRVVDDQHCTPSYVPHVARAVLFLAGVTGLRPAPWGTYHVANRGETTWYDFAAEVFRAAGIPVSLERISTAEYGAAAARPAYSVLDTTAYHRLGGPPMPDWKAAVAEYVGEMRRHQ
jgi:dTDP-4-dehydrorhamnose reductase